MRERIVQVRLLECSDTIAWHVFPLTVPDLVKPKSPEATKANLIGGIYASMRKTLIEHYKLGRNIECINPVAWLKREQPFDKGGCYHLVSVEMEYPRMRENGLGQTKVSLGSEILKRIIQHPYSSSARHVNRFVRAARIYNSNVITPRKGIKTPR